jgi:iron complex transport system ATP-binding protein
LASIVELTHVSLQRGGKWILQDVSWYVQPGQHWAVLGANGSGKTTLFQILTGYLWPTEGQVTVLGKRFGTFDLRELRKSIGIVSASVRDQFQSSQPSERSVDVVVSGKFASIGVYDEVTPDDEERAMHLLAVFGCLDVANQPFHTLSQGEKQRVLLARAWMANPALLVLDEPCSGLDIPGREQLLMAIRRLMREPNGPTLIFVTHHAEEILPEFQHTLLLHQGKVMAQGPTSHVVTSKRLSECFGLPMEVEWAHGRPWIRVVQFE